MNRESRLSKAGIEVNFSEDCVPLSTLISVIDVNVTKAWQPGTHGDMSDRLVKLSKHLGLPQGLPAEVLISWPVRADLDILSALKSLAQDDDSDSASLVRQYNHPDLRGSYRKLLNSSRDNCFYEGMVGLSQLGFEDRDYAPLVSKIFGDTEHLKYAAFAFLAQAGMHEKLLETDNRITELLDSDENLAAMVEFATNGTVDSVQTLTQLDDWQNDVAIGYFLRGQMKNHSSMEVLGYMLEKLNNVTDSDVLTSWSWAVGQCVKNLGVDGAVHVLEFVRDNMDGNDKNTFVLNALLRYRPEAQEVAEMTEILNELSADDRDIKKAVGRVSDFWKEQYAANNWLFKGGYGRAIDFFEADSIMPEDVSGILLPHNGNSSSLLQTISFLSQFSHDAPVVSAVLSSMLHTHPNALGLYTKLLEEKSDSDLQKGIAIALLFTKEDHSVSPLMLRCYLGADVGGPVPEGPETMGEMLGYYGQWKLKKSVVGLMRLGSKELRTQVASFLNTSLLFNDNDDDRNNIFKLGLVFDGVEKVADSPVLWSLSAGFDFDAGLLEQQFSSGSAEDKEALGNHLCSSMATGEERDALKSLAQIGAVWGLIEADKTQPIVDKMINQSGWVQKEVGCILATNIGPKVLEGSLGTKIKDRILALVNDNDSDVEREAKNACAVLNIEFVLINAETIRQNLIHGTDDYDAWVNHLWEFMGSGDRQELLSLARVPALWECLDTEKVADQWLKTANESSWVKREFAAVLLATSGADILTSTVASDISNRIIEMTSDSDSDVQREAKLACDNHAISYV